MLNQVSSYIRRNGLLQEGNRVLVALSGGADSVVLLHVLLRLGYDIRAAHCNFHLRGEESMRDEHFVRDLCSRLGVDLVVRDFDTFLYAHTHGVSIEMAARDLRYEWFETLRQEFQCDAIAVAHHQNDQAETLLLNLSRGAGLRGLGGIRPKNGNIVRPLLELTRTEIETFAEAEHLAYVTDSTNADTSIRRNAFRHILQEADDSAIRHMAQTAERMQQYRMLLDALILGTPIPEEAEPTLLYELLSPYGFNASQARDILTSLPLSGKRFDALDFSAFIDHGVLTIRSKQAEADEVPNLLRAVRPRMPREHFPAADETRVLLDADKLPEQLVLRHRQDGDFFYPIAVKGKAVKRKLQDFFSDLKLSAYQKDHTWLLCEADKPDNIIWIIGYRIDDRYKITEQTRRIAEIEIDK